MATIQYIKDVKLNERGVEVGNIIRTRFEAMQTKFPQIGDGRGLGAMMAIEFVKNGDPRQPDGDLCSQVVKGCAEQGLIIISAGTYKNNIRVLSPLTISNDLLNKGLDIIEEEIRKATLS